MIRLLYTKKYLMNSLIFVFACVYVSGCYPEGRPLRFSIEEGLIGHVVLVHGGRYLIITSSEQKSQYLDAECNVLNSYDKWLSASSPVSEFENQVRIVVESSTRSSLFLFLPLSETWKSEADTLANMAAEHKKVIGTGFIRGPIEAMWNKNQDNDEGGSNELHEANDL